MTEERRIYLVSYDISGVKRLCKVRRAVSAYAVGGQKSFYECWMFPREIPFLVQELREIFDENKDRIHIFELNRSEEPVFIGEARRQSTEPFLIV